jgi:ribA/ribD-fused uncharacterized protein
MMTDTITSFTGSYGWLSNFHRGNPFYLPGWQALMPTAEHAYQACKARTGEQAHWVLDAPSAQLAKSRGRQVDTHPDWDQRKKRIMLKILLAKFDNEQLASWLVSTGDAQLIEGNTWGDTFWGAVPARNAVVLHRPGPPPIWQPDTEKSHDPDTWLAGWNWLGRELMMVREVLR